MRFLLIPVCLFFFAYLKAQSGANPAWKADMEHLRKELPKRHKYLYFQTSQKEFERGLQWALGADSDFGFAVRLQQQVAAMGDSHTGVVWEQFVEKEKVLPLRFSWLSDGIFILNTTTAYKNLLGSRLVGIGNVSVQTVQDSLETIITIDNQALVKTYIPRYMAYSQLLEYFGFTEGDSILLKLQDAHGDAYSAKIGPEQLTRENAEILEREKVPLYLQRTSELFWDILIPEDSIYYVQYNSCTGREVEKRYGDKERAKKMPSFRKFEKKVIRNLRKHPEAKLVFDMRFNGGGSSRQGTQLIRKISGLKHLNRNGRIYVVTGRRTFSSAIINSMDFKRMTKAIFLGEETGGKPNHYGEVRSFTLPESGLLVRYSTKYFKYEDEGLNTIRPDHIIETRFEQYKSGVDPVMEFVRAQDN